MFSVVCTTKADRVVANLPLTPCLPCGLYFTHTSMRSFRLYRFPECQGKMFVVVTVVLLTSGVTLLSEMLNLH